MRVSRAFGRILTIPSRGDAPGGTGASDEGVYDPRRGASVQLSAPRHLRGIRRRSASGAGIARVGRRGAKGNCRVHSRPDYSGFSPSIPSF